MRGRVNAIRTFKGLVADLRVNKDFTKPGVFLTFTSPYAGYINLDSMILMEYNGSKKVGKSTTVLVNGSAEIAMIKGMTKI